jgi:molybdopterin-guanine dinucleotide biosynthesis protein A
MPINDLAPCSVLILAGGRGQRMGGQDKGLVLWRGQPLIAHLHGIVRPLTDDLIISCNRNHERYAEYADQWVYDSEQDFPGPLAGIRAALKVARHPYLLVLPCDAPLIDRALLDALRHTAAQHPQQAVMLRQNGYWQPLCSLIPTCFQARLEHAWKAGERSPRHVLLDIGAVALDCAPEDPRLANFNTAEVLRDH